MRREIRCASGDFDAGGAHMISFQMSNDGARFACCVMVRAPSREDAIELFQYNWTRIEETARECLIQRSLEQSESRLIMA